MVLIYILDIQCNFILELISKIYRYVEKIFVLFIKVVLDILVIILSNI